MPSEPPTGWTATTVQGLLDDAQSGEIKTGPFGTVLSAKEYSEEGVPLVAVKEIREGYIAIHDDTPRVPPEVVERLNHFLLAEGDVVFARKGGVERCAVVGQTSTMMLGSDAIRLRLPTGMSYRFVGFALQSERHRRWMNNQATGSIMSGLNQRIISRIPLLLPPLPEQKKIAAILSSVDEAIQATQAVIEQTQRVKEGLLQDLLTKGIGHTRFKQTEIGEIPKTWRVAPLGSLIAAGRPICYGILKPGRGVPGGVPVVKVKNIQDGEIDTSDLLLTNPEIDAAYTRSKLLPKDVLLSIRGTTGRVAIVPESLRDANITQDTARITTDSDKASHEFVYYALQSRRLQRYIDLHTIGQAVKGINIAEVRRIPLALPPLEEQRRLLEVLSANWRFERAEASKLESLREAKSGLLQDLLTGKVRVSV